MIVSDQDIIDVAEQYAKRYRILHDQEDVKQEICLALLRARERYDPKRASWATYSNRIARGVLADCYRRDPTWDRWSQAIVRFNEYIDDGATEDDNLVEEVDLHEFLRKLSPRSRLITLCLLSGMTARDIARILEVSEGKVYQNILKLRIESSRLSLSVRKA